MKIGKLEEKKQKNLKGISKAIYILAKIMRVFCIIGIVGITIGIVTVGVVGSSVKLDPKNKQIEVFKEKYKYEINDNKITIIDSNNKIDTFDIEDLDIINLNKFLEKIGNHESSYYVILAEVFMTFALLMLIITVLILKTAAKLFKNINKDDTPFTLENTEYIKRIAKYMIVAMILTIISSITFSVLTGGNIKSSISLTNIVYILVVFAIAYIFEYGYELQKKSDMTIYNKSE